MILGSVFNEKKRLHAISTCSIVERQHQSVLQILLAAMGLVFVEGV